MPVIPYNGRYCSITIAGSTTMIELMGHWEIGVNFDELDASQFGTVWKYSMNGMQGWNGSFNGFLYSSTAAGSTGQNAIQLACFQQTLIQDIRFYVESTAAGSANSTSCKYWAPNCSTSFSGSTSAGAFIGNFRMAADKNGLITASYDVRGYGPLAMFVGSSTAAIVY